MPAWEAQTRLRAFNDSNRRDVTVGALGDDAHGVLGLVRNENLPAVDADAVRVVKERRDSEAHG